MIDSIVYVSKTGFTERYARMLSEKTGLPARPLGQEGGSEVIFLGWVMASGVKGLKKALKTLNVHAVCAVGMDMPCEDTVEKTRKANSLEADMPLFFLRGGFNKQKIGGFNKIIMKVIANSLEKKQPLTEDDREMLIMLKEGADLTSEEQLAPVLEWYESAK